MKKQLLGALALSGALVFGGAMPAFAAATAETSGETPVTIQTTISRVDVTVPIALPIIAEANGNNNCLAPSENVYKFINKSGVIPMKVISAQVMPGSNNAAYANWTLASYSADGITLPAADASAAFGTISMKLTPQTENTNANQAGAVDLFTYMGDDATTFASLMDADGQDAWKIAKNEGELPIAIAAMNSPLKMTQEDTTEAFKICWTVASDF